MSFTRLALIALACASFAGCSAFKINPQTSGSTAFRTPVEGATAQLILSDAFQRTVITEKPAYGTSWKIYSFEINAGEPLSKALASDLRSRIPSARVGNRDDGKPSTVTVVPSTVTIEFGVDDGRASGLMALGLIGSFSEVVVGAKAKVTASIAVAGGSTETVEVLGLAAVPVTFLTLAPSDVTKAVGLALDNAALKMGDIVEAKARKK